MVLVRILKRKDASSLIVGVAIALGLNQLLGQIAFPLSYKLTSTNNEFGGLGGGWKQEYLTPVVAFLVQLVLLEVVARVVVIVRQAIIDNRPR